MQVREDGTLRFEPRIKVALKLLKDVRNYPTFNFISTRASKILNFFKNLSAMYKFKFYI